MPRAPRVLCYAPYNRWIQHAAWEMTIVHGLRLRGAEVRHVFCDGAYDECDVFWASTDARHPLSCVQCQAEVSKTALNMQSPFEWLGRYVIPAELREARRWADLLPEKRLTTATYGDWDVAGWVESSLHSHFRANHLDTREPHVAAAYRRYLYSGLVACFGLTRLIDDVQPDVLFLFNGRMSSPRVALELARRRGIRVVVHERGLRPETISLFEDAHCLSLTPFKTLWQDWGDVPLRDEEVETIRRHLAGREHGTGFSWPTFNPSPQDVDELRAQLRLSAGRPLWALFTSCEDEVISDGDWQSPFAGQLDWIERTVAYAARHPEISLVIRVHPNTGGARSFGQNRDQLRQMEELGGRLPGNARLVMPDDGVSAYSLMDIATVGLVFQSTTALELACKGKTTVLAAGSHVTGLPFVQTIESAAGYEAVLDRLRDVPLLSVSADVQRLAYRFAYAMYFRWTVPFPLVKMAENGSVALAFNSFDELRPGRSADLDRVTRIILDGEPVCPPPAVERLAGAVAPLACADVG